MNYNELRINYKSITNKLQVNYICEILIKFNKHIKKLDVWTLVKEPIVLKQEKCHNKTLHVINLRFGYFYTRNFIIHGANDLKFFCDIAL
jgi:hypothetical protein